MFASAVGKQWTPSHALHFSFTLRFGRFTVCFFLRCTAHTKQINRKIYFNICSIFFLCVLFSIDQFLFRLKLLYNIMAFDVLVCCEYVCFTHEIWNFRFYLCVKNIAKKKTNENRKKHKKKRRQKKKHCLLSERFPLNGWSTVDGPPTMNLFSRQNKNENKNENRSIITIISHREKIDEKDHY